MQEVVTTHESRDRLLRDMRQRLLHQEGISEFQAAQNVEELEALV